MKIYRQNPRASARPPRKLRKFTDETNMQARNHENSDEICAQPVRHLDLATPAFYYYRKNPNCYHTVWGKNLTFESRNHMVGLVGSTHLKNMPVKMGIFPEVRGENKKYLKPPPRG